MTGILPGSCCTAPASSLKRYTMVLIELRLPGNKTIWINPDHIISLQEEDGTTWLMLSNSEHLHLEESVGAIIFKLGMRKERN